MKKKCLACGNLVETEDDYCKKCGNQLIETKDFECDDLEEKLSIDKDKIILLDLNYTLISNSKESFGTYPNRIYKQEYETGLIDLIKDNYVILITARPYKYSFKTLAHIKEKTGFVPDETYWNFDNYYPQDLKKFWMEEEIIPKHGDDMTKYLAIESNEKTRRMYRKLGIKARRKQCFI